MNKYKGKYIFRNDNGLIFPWMLILCFIFLLVTFASIERYETHLPLSKSHQTAILKQHLLDTARIELNEELKKVPLEQNEFTTSTQSPDGDVEAECFRETEQWNCLQQITIHVNESQFQVRTFHTK